MHEWLRSRLPRRTREPRARGHGVGPRREVTARAATATSRSTARSHWSQDGSVAATRPPRSAPPSHRPALGAQGRMTARRRRRPLTPELLGGLVERAGRPDFPRLEAQLRSSGYCARPVRLRGHDRDVRRARPPARVVDRRPNRTASCARRAATAARPSARRARSATARTPTTSSRRPAEAARACRTRSPSTRPCSSRSRRRASGSCTRAARADGQPRRCRPRRDAPVCPHGVRLSCGAVHDDDDPCLGEPLCLECFDHAGGGGVEQHAAASCGAARRSTCRARSRA